MNLRFIKGFVSSDVRKREKPQIWGYNGRMKGKETYEKLLYCFSYQHKCMRVG